MKIENKKVYDFLNQEYKDYANYVIEGRALSSCIDGFKPTQRKIIYAASKYAGGAKVKVNVLAGMVIANCQYHHGDVSCSDAIINMAQTFKNNLPLLEDIGIYGSLRNPHASSARYISTKLSKNYNLIYKDESLLENTIIDGFVCEYKHYLPIIPMILINGSDGIAVGFSMKILNRNPLDVINACISYLNGSKINLIKPMIGGFDGEFINDSENHKKWTIRGKYNILPKNKLEIVELPPSMTYEKYELILDKLQDDKVITYKNDSKDNIKYVVKFNNIASFTPEKLIKLFKLEEFKTENLTTLDENGKLKIFDCVEDIIKYFVDFRLTYYQKRKDHILSELDNKSRNLTNKAKFIKLILDNKLKINGRKKDDVVTDLIKNKLDMIDDSYDYLLRMPIYSLTLELFNKINEDLKTIAKEIEDTQSLVPKTMYKEDLNTLKKSFKK